MSIGTKIRKLRESKNLSQPQLSEILNISQSELSKIENNQTKKIDFLFMNKVCTFFETDFEFFTKTDKQVNNIKKLEGSVNNHGTINLFPENILEQLKSIIDENAVLRAENQVLKSGK
jgi:transcriptional regulator with XRE-family HTH domain